MGTSMHWPLIDVSGTPRYIPDFLLLPMAVKMYCHNAPLLLHAFPTPATL